MIESYLARIGIERPRQADLAALRAIHRAHLLAIPYENLDVQLGTRLTTSPSDAFEKLVRRKRGGWCYEMNGVLGWALEQLGFRVTRGAGAVMREVSGDQVIGNHLVLRVDLDECVYLADAGFGDGPIEPFAVAERSFSDGRFEFALSDIGNGWWRLHNHPLGAAKSFDFTLQRGSEDQLARLCDFLQTAPVSPFVQNLVCQRHTTDGLVVLRGKVLRRITPVETKERILASADELVSVLESAFGLHVPEAATLWPKIQERHAAVFGDIG